VPDEETLAHPEQPRFLLSSWIWAVVLFVFFGAIVALTFTAMRRGSDYEDKRADERATKLKTAREEWNAKLNQYGWVDKEKGVAHIPIQRAMALEMADLRGKPPPPAAAPAGETGASQPANPTLQAPPAATATPATTAKGPASENHGQPAGTGNPPNAVPGTQPGANATPAAQPKSDTAVPPVSPTGTPILKAPGTPLPVRGAPTPKR
jgi:hypothetical protein